MKTKPGGRTTKKNLIRRIETIANEAVNSDFSSQFIRNIKASADEISVLLRCTRIQSVLFSVICNLNFSNKTVSLEQIADWIGCNPITIGGYLNELDDLRAKKIILKAPEDKNAGSICLGTATSYSVNPEVFDALRKGIALKRRKKWITGNYELVKAMVERTEQMLQDEITPQELCREIAGIESACSGMELMKEVKTLVKDRNERLLFFNLCNEFYDGKIYCDLTPLLQAVTPDKKEQFQLRLRFTHGISELSASGLTEMKQIIFRSEKEICLSEKGVEMLTRDTLKTSGKVKKTELPDIIPASVVKEKSLFFTQKEMEQHEFLAQLLSPDRFIELQTRLNRSGMKTGVAVLFYGEPGTGKTESVLQLARRTGRDLLQVNISETKSKWYGESEKRIKEVFDRYKKLVEECEIAPILFFNEADAIFGSRKQVGVSLVDQTENTIQNIILQEMEDLQGILIATTNLMLNFDKAFDRRFLYKIQFEKTSPEARSQIWLDKIPSLKESIARQLAKNYELSGGQIDNVARKFIMHKILKSNVPNTLQIESWCVEESLSKEVKRIGYKQ